MQEELSIATKAATSSEFSKARPRGGEAILSCLTPGNSAAVKCFIITSRRAVHNCGYTAVRIRFVTESLVYAMTVHAVTVYRVLDLSWSRNHRWCFPGLTRIWISVGGHLTLNVVLRSYWMILKGTASIKPSVGEGITTRVGKDCEESERSKYSYLKRIENLVQRCPGTVHSLNDIVILPVLWLSQLQQNNFLPYPTLSLLLPHHVFLLQPWVFTLLT